MRIVRTLLYYFSRLVFLLFLRFASIASFFEQVTPLGHNLINCLFEILTGFVLAKKLFAHKKHSYAEPIAGNILVMSIARADLLAILNWITTQRHSRAVTVAVRNFIFSKAFLYLFDYFCFREKCVSSLRNVFLREIFSAGDSVFGCQFSIRQ
jgi:hypothetical protein